MQEQRNFIFDVSVRAGRRAVNAVRRAFTLTLLATLVLGARPSSLNAQEHPITAAATSLVKAQKPDGLFNYEYNFISGTYSKKDNIVRQAGAGYGLAEFYFVSRNESVRDAIVAALRAYSSLSVQFGSGKLVSLNGRLDTAKAGATALALLTELQYAVASGDQQFDEIRTLWIKGLLALYRQGKGFSKHPKTEKESPYFNGEIWLALSYFDRFFSQSTVSDSFLKKIDQYLMDSYSRKPRSAFYQWGVMAAAQRYAATGHMRFAEFIAQQTTAYMDELRPDMRQHANTCSAIEGLATAVGVLEAARLNERLRARVVQRVKEEMTKNLQFQIKPNQEKIDFGEDRILYSQGIRNFNGAFLNGLYRPKIRIDFTQHCLSAMIKYRSIGLE